MVDRALLNEDKERFWHVFIDVYVSQTASGFLTLEARHKPERANRCVSHGLAHSHNVNPSSNRLLSDFFLNGNERTDIRTEGPTDYHIKMRGLSYKDARTYTSRKKDQFETRSASIREAVVHTDLLSNVDRILFTYIVFVFVFRSWFFLKKR